MAQDRPTNLTLFSEANDDPMGAVRMARMLVASLLISSERPMGRVAMHRTLWRVARLLDTAAGTKIG